MSLEKVSYQKLNEEIDKVDTKMGDLSSLSTTSKSSLVSAINETFTNVSNGKTLIASAITDKGISTSSDATFQTMATNISNIETGITPTGTININTNGTYNVTNYASANVSVSGQGPTLITKTITSNGVYNASSDNADGYSQVTVNVPVGSTNSRCFKKVITTKPSSIGYVYINDEGDSEIAAHKDDETFVATIMCISQIDATLRIIGSSSTNHKLSPASSNSNYGMMIRSNAASSITYSGLANGVTNGANGQGLIYATSDGRIGICNTTAYPVVPGTYVAICGW